MTTTRELLESYMAGTPLTEADIDSLLTNKTKEDLHLDYKSGKELLNTDAKDTIRRYMTAFANSDGGLLIIGISDDLQRVESGRAPGGRGFEHWAASCLDMFSLFSPLPRFQTVHHRDGDVYIAGASRSLNIIPCREGGGQAYHLRIHDQTRRAPDYLVSDLILGRRQYPLLDISGVSVEPWLTHSPDHMMAFIELSTRFSIENHNLHWAENLRMGIINYSCSEDGTTTSSQLLSYVDLRGYPSDVLPGSFVLYHSIQPINDVVPFTENHESLSRDISLPIKTRKGRWVNYDWKGALYIIGKNILPIWYQLSISVDVTLAELGRARQEARHLMTVERVHQNRPILLVDNLRDAP